jgi:hypothetical protein
MQKHVVVRDALCSSSEMGLTRVVHVKAHLLDHVVVKPSEVELLESTSYRT